MSTMRASIGLLTYVLTASLAGFTSTSAQADATNVAPQTLNVYLVEGANLAPRVRSRVTALLKSVASAHVIEISDTTQIPSSAKGLVVSIGDTPITRGLIPETELAEQGPEGFIVRSKSSLGLTTIAANGNAARAERTTSTTNRGVSFAAYEILQQLGFHFYHPFTPTAPGALVLPLNSANAGVINVKEKPRWPTRGLHLHTMHPIELAHVLNGWGPDGPANNAKDTAGFEAELREWDLFLEWMIAHRQNQVEWVLLADKTHLTYNDSPERIARLKTVVDMSHAWGLLSGIDVGLIFEQQNMWRLLRNVTTDEADNNEIRGRLKWLMQAGWDFVTAEMGASEFTSPEDTKMLLWMNTLTSEVENGFNRYAAVKIHITQGQTANHFTDPDTQSPLNFNFLPAYADKKLTVLAHTVELYALDDPAPTYGNSDWKEIHRFLSMEAGTRPVIFYPEATYWVSYDIDTPLFLPAYAERRLHDLRLIAREEDAGLLGRGAQKGARIQGQMLFSSGFEWGYWLNNAVAMHAAWNPRLNEDQRTAFENTVREILRPDPASTQTTNKLVSLLSDIVIAQDDLLIQGKVNGKAPRQIERMTGIAYLSGQETWDELNTLLAELLGIKKAPTQPIRLGFRSLRAGIDGQGVNFISDVHPLLDAMEVSFAELSARMIDLFSKTAMTDTNKQILSEFADGAMMNTLRASQVHALYDATAAANMNQTPAWRAQKIARARHALDLASDVVTRREKQYRSSIDRINEWQTNPSVYNYGYLWTVHSLFWWYRDEGNVTLEPSNICFMNIVNPANTIFAEGKDNTYYQWAQRLADLAGFGSIKECLSPSMVEPQPRARVRPTHQ